MLILAYMEIKEKKNLCIHMSYLLNNTDSQEGCHHW